MNYRSLRSIHLISGAFALPVLVMYGVSAVQMAHGKWFDLKPIAVIKHSLQLPSGNDDGRKMAREAMARTDVHGEIETVSTTANGFNVRVTVPGTVHVIEYDRTSGATSVRTTVAGAMGMLATVATGYCPINAVQRDPELEAPRWRTLKTYRVEP